MVRYHNAKDAEGHIVDIKVVTKENRAEKYYCVGCGCEMSPVLGEKNLHHFRHKEDHCSWESYLHKLGKEKFKERFECQKEFPIKYYVNYQCDKYDNCKLKIFFKDNCNRKDLIVFDLKKVFDTCEEEVTYNGFRADLMLSNSEHPEIKPLFIEVSVTHDCEPEKLRSGIQIIEIKISDENDVLNPLVEEDSLFLLSAPDSIYDSSALPPIRFYNFNRIIESGYPLDRFWVAKDNKGLLRGNCIQGNITCRNVMDNHIDDSIYEINVPSGTTINNKPLDLYSFGMSKATKADIGVKHCDLCDNFKRCILNYTEEIEDKTTGEKKLVNRKVLMQNMANTNLDKVVQANSCENYKPNLVAIYFFLQPLRNLPYWEWKKENVIE